MRKHATRTAALLFGTAALASGLALGLAVPAHANDEPVRASGLAANGPIDIAPLPAVGNDGGLTREGLVRQSLTPLVDASALAVVAGPEYGQAQTAGVAALESQLRASALASQCTGSGAGAHLAQLGAGEQKLIAAPAPNTTLPVTVEGIGTASVTANKQVQDASGATSVSALQAAVPLGRRMERINIASANCGTAERSDVEESESDTTKVAVLTRNVTTLVTDLAPPLTDVVGPIEQTTGDLTDSIDQAETQTESQAEAVKEVTDKAPLPVPAKVDLPVAG